MAYESNIENILNAVKTFIENTSPTYFTGICAAKADGILCPAFEEVVVDDGDPYERGAYPFCQISRDEYEDKQLTINSEELIITITLVLGIVNGIKTEITTQIDRYMEGIRQMLIDNPTLGGACDKFIDGIKGQYFPALPDMSDKRLALITFKVSKEVLR